MRWVSERDLQQPRRIRLFCLPHAGSGVAGFYRWKRMLPEDVAVCPILLPGREGRLAESLLHSVREVVEALDDEVGAALDRPFAVFGHSMGALLAFEWVKRMQARGGRLPSVLLVSGRNAPQMGPGHRGLAGMADAELVVELGRRYGGAPETLLEDEEMRAVFMPIVRADLGMVEGYSGAVVWTADEKLDVPVRAYAGTGDASVSDEGLDRWREVTVGDFEARRFVGDHFYHFGEGQGELVRMIGEKLLAATR